PTGSSPAGGLRGEEPGPRVCPLVPVERSQNLAGRKVDDLHVSLRKPDVAERAGDVDPEATVRMELPALSSVRAEGDEAWPGRERLLVLPRSPLRDHEPLPDREAARSAAQHLCPPGARIDELHACWGSDHVLALRALVRQRVVEARNGEQAVANPA